MFKTCNKCHKQKSASEFGKDKIIKDGLKGSYKECVKKKQRAWYEKNREKVIAKVAKFRKENPDVIRDRKTEEYHKHKEKYKSRAKSHYQKNKGTEKFKEDSNRRTREWRKEHRHICAWRSVLKVFLHRGTEAKWGKTKEMLGYTYDEFKNHIERLWTPGMNWDNYGEWHIDHIQQVSLFPVETPCKIVNALSNLRPLWATTRIIDGIAYEGNLNRTHCKGKKRTKRC